MKSTQAQLLNILLFGAQSAPGARRITEAEKRDLQDGADLRQRIEDMENVVAREFPSLPKEHSARVAEFNFGLALTIGDAPSEIASEVSGSILKKLVEAKIPWALAFAKANVDDRVRPAYAKAAKAGVEPVPFLQADLQVSAAEAQAMVDAIHDEEAKAETS